MSQKSSSDKAAASREKRAPSSEGSKQECSETPMRARWKDTTTPHRRAARPQGRAHTVQCCMWEQLGVLSIKSENACIRHKWLDTSLASQDLIHLWVFDRSILTSAVVPQAQRSRFFLFSQCFFPFSYFLFTALVVLWVWHLTPGSQISCLLGTGRSLSTHCLHLQEVGFAGGVSQYSPVLVLQHL